MSRRSEREAAQLGRVRYLKGVFKKGSMVYTMRVWDRCDSHAVKVIAVLTDGRTPYILDVSHSVSVALGWRFLKSGSVCVRGGNMDPGFHLAQCLSYALWKNSYALYHRWV